MPICYKFLLWIFLFRGNEYVQACAFIVTNKRFPRIPSVPCYLNSRSEIQLNPIISYNWLKICLAAKTETSERQCHQPSATVKKLQQQTTKDIVKTLVTLLYRVRSSYSYNVLLFIGSGRKGKQNAHDWSRKVFAKLIRRHWLRER